MGKKRLQTQFLLLEIFALLSEQFLHRGERWDLLHKSTQGKYEVR